MIEKYNEKVLEAREIAIELIKLKGNIEKNKIDKMIDLYNEAIDMVPNRTEPYLALAYMSWIMGLYEGSIGLLKTAKKESPLDEKVDEMLMLVERDYIKNKEKQLGKKLSNEPELIKPNSYEGLFKFNKKRS